MAGSKTCHKPQSHGLVLSLQPVRQKRSNLVLILNCTVHITGAAGGLSETGIVQKSI